MSLVDVTKELPEDLKTQLLDGEVVYYFSYTDSAAVAYQNGRMWMMITNKRVIYDASVKDNKAFKRMSGSIPVDKISFVSVTTTKTPETGCGCWSSTVYVLTVGSGGGKIDVAVPSEDEAKRLQTKVSEVQGAIQ